MPQAELAAVEDQRQRVVGVLHGVQAEQDDRVVAGLGLVVDGCVEQGQTVGQGVALLATLGDIPAGLVPLDGLPEPKPLPLSIWAAADIPARVARTACDALRPLLPRTHTGLAARLSLAEGA